MIVTQTAFRKGLLDPGLPAPEGLQNPDGAQATKRFDVYRNNVAASLSDALEAAFPVIRKLVGDEFFRAMAGVYLRKFPPSSPLMMFYGEHLPQFLTRFEPTKNHRYLPDIARVELAIRKSYHAADAAPIDGQALAAIAPEDLMALCMTIAPAVQVVSSKDYPIHAIYIANTRDNAPKPEPGAESVLIARPQFDPTIHKISTADATCIKALQDGKSLGMALAEAGDDLDLGATLGLLLSQRAITDLN